MSNTLTGWLNDNPLNKNSGGPSNVDNLLIGSVTLTHYELVPLYNVLISPNWQSIFVGGFADAKEWITRLLRFPFPVPSLPQKTYLKYGSLDTSTEGDESKVICYTPAFTNAAGNLLRSMGKIYINKYFNNFMDYNGYTKIEVYLPFCGTVEVLPNDTMGLWMFVDLFIDYYTGKGIYYISVNENEDADSANRRIILTKECTLGYDIPIGGTNANASVGNMIRGTVKTIGSVAMLSTLSGATTTNTGTKTTFKTKYNDRSKSTTTTKTTTNFDYTTQHQIGAGTIGSAAVSGTMDAINNLQTTANSDRCNNAMLDLAGPKSVKVVIKRPKPIPVGEDYNKIYGRPAAYTKKLKELTGYTKITGIHLENFLSALTEELEMLDRQLKVGIILDGDTKVIFPPEPTEGLILATSDNQYVYTSDEKYIELEE